MRICNFSLAIQMSSESNDANSAKLTLRERVNASWKEFTTKMMTPDTVAVVGDGPKTLDKPTTRPPGFRDNDEDDCNCDMVENFRTSISLSKNVLQQSHVTLLYHSEYAYVFLSYCLLCLSFAGKLRDFLLGESPERRALREQTEAASAARADARRDAVAGSVDAARLRAMYDEIKSHGRGLEAMGDLPVAFRRFEAEDKAATVAAARAAATLAAATPDPVVTNNAGAGAGATAAQQG